MSGVESLPGLLGETDMFLFNEGTHRRLHHHLGAHPLGGATWFAVWAPSAREVGVVGDVGDWHVEHRLEQQQQSGIWAGVLDGFEAGHRYKFRIHSADGAVVDKADPFAAQAEEPPRTASVIADLHYVWGDGEWMAEQGSHQAVDAPISIYEVHLGSWGRRLAEGRRFPTYEELAEPLAEHALAHGFTHVELLPIMEHPFYGSWGYQSTGYFAPSARFGHPTGLMRMIDHMHQRGVGVILDWVPSHFPDDEHGLARFDGTHLYEHADPRQGWHPDWQSNIFNYGRHEVRGFLISSAISWLERYHVDGLRVDAVASMLYLDYSRQPGEWTPNRYGGRENLEAVEFLRQLNTAVFTEHPGTTTFAEESTAWPMVSRPTYVGGLGFGFKWDMGWMHDSLSYMSRDPVHRHWHHHEMTFRSVYAFSENYVLPLSHDEVVYGKGSLLGKMPGDWWQQRANLRLLYAWQWAQPGKKLLFMGGELPQGSEWAHEGTLEWWRHDDEESAGVRAWVRDLNAMYRWFASMHRGDCDPAGFRWLEANDVENCVYAFLRSNPGAPDDSPVAVVFNFTPVVRANYRLGVPRPGRWRELLNSDATEYGGSGTGNFGGAETDPVPGHGEYQSLNLTLPPLGALFLVPDE
jgi:1,4-alpha-glucan branching enzyme